MGAVFRELVMNVVLYPNDRLVKHTGA